VPCIPFQGVFHSATLYKLSINAIKQPTPNIDRTNHQNKRNFQTLFLLRAARFFGLDRLISAHGDFGMVFTPVFLPTLFFECLTIFFHFPPSIKAFAAYLAAAIPAHHCRPLQGSRPKAKK